MVEIFEPVGGIHNCRLCNGGCKERLKQAGDVGHGRTFRGVDDVLMRDSQQIQVATDLELFKGGEPACPGSWKADFNLDVWTRVFRYTACLNIAEARRPPRASRTFDTCAAIIRSATAIFYLPLACSDFRSPTT
jgi:hypothetical protein